MQVSQERLRADLLENGAFGAIETDEGYGRTVLTGSEADRKARERLVGCLEGLGMDVRIDAVGNVAGRWVPDGVDPETPAIAAGSHLDSVPSGGIFDGPLGVYAAVEAVRAIQESELAVERPIEVVAFTEEEGQRFGIGLLGSSVAAGQRSVEEALALEDESGTTLRERLDGIDFHGEGRLDASEWDAWFEIHVEQSTELEDAGVPVGLVTAITGITNCGVEIVGESNHAGGTLMGDRTDALVAASAFVADVNDAAREIVETESPFAVATVGELDVEPGARNVIPGGAELSIDIRDVDEEIMDELVDRARLSLARIESDHGVDTALDRFRTTEPARMSDRCLDALRAAGADHGIELLELPSGGGHDTMSVARVTETGMLFAPSVGGISHSPQEWTDWEDCARTTQVLASAIARLAAE